MRLHLAGREIEQLRSRERKRADARGDLAQEEQDVRVRLRALDAEVMDAEHALAIPGDDDVADLLARTVALRERSRGLVNLVAERTRGLERELTAVADEGVVESLVAEAAQLREQLAAVDADFDALAPTRAEVDAAEARVSPLVQGPSVGEAETVYQGARRDVDELAERSATVERELLQTRETLARTDDEREALKPAITEADSADTEAARVRTELESRAAVAPELTSEGQELRATEDVLQAADAAWREAEAEASRWRARAEMLAMALDEAHAAAGGEHLADLDGVLGPLVDLLEIDDGVEVAVAAALGDALQAIVVDGDSAARAAVERLKRGDRHALMLVAEGRAVACRSRSRRRQTRPLGACVRGLHDGLDPVLARLFAPFVLVDGGWEQALDVALANPGVIAVTREGDRFGGPSPWRAGPPGSSVVTPAALAERRHARMTPKPSAIPPPRRSTRRASGSLPRGAPSSSRPRTNGAAAPNWRASSLARRSCGATSRSAPRRSTNGAPRFRRVSRSSKERSRRFPTPRSPPAAVSHGPSSRATTRGRVAASTSGCGRSLRRCGGTSTCGVQRSRNGAPSSAPASSRSRPGSRPGPTKRRRRAPGAAASRIGGRRSPSSRSASATAPPRSKRSPSGSRSVAARSRRQHARPDDSSTDCASSAPPRRSSSPSCGSAPAGSRSRKAEIRLRLEQAIETVRREYDCEPDVAVAAPTPEVPDGASLPARARELERELRLMGPINPLALSEYDALLERHEFLQQQLDDVKNTRRELTRVIKTVDEEIVRVFEIAFADVARNFSELFSMLFPGGSGRLVLTNPDDLLNTGIEMEARPSGKMVRRLSLLSGGERSLAALAYLFGVFRARPSPFYLMDEVEAALDDVNLHRFLDLVHEFRNEAQLLVVSHQKRTMEAADVLYGVSMPPGGSSRVVSQRINDLQFEDSPA